MPVTIYDAVTWSEGRGKPKNPMSCMPVLLVILRAMLMVPAILRIWLVVHILSIE